MRVDGFQFWMLADVIEDVPVEQYAPIQIERSINLTHQVVILQFPDKHDHDSGVPRLMSLLARRPNTSSR